MKTNIVICLKDPNILVLMVFVYALNKINEKWNMSQLTSQQSFPGFMQLQGVSQLLFYMSFEKVKVSQWKKKLRLLNTIGVSCKVSDKTVNPLSAKLRKWPNTLKQFVGNLPTNCLSVFGHFVGLALKGSKMLKSLIKLFATLEKKKRVLLKPECYI